MSSKKNIKLDKIVQFILSKKEKKNKKDIIEKMFDKYTFNKKYIITIIINDIFSKKKKKDDDIVILKLIIKKCITGLSDKKNKIQSLSIDTLHHIIYKICLKKKFNDFIKEILKYIKNRLKKKKAKREIKYIEYATKGHKGGNIEIV